MEHHIAVKHGLADTPGCRYEQISPSSVLQTTFVKATRKFYRYRSLSLSSRRTIAASVARLLLTLCGPPRSLQVQYVHCPPSLRRGASSIPNPAGFAPAAPSRRSFSFRLGPRMTKVEPRTILHHLPRLGCCPLPTGMVRGASAMASEIRFFTAV